MGRGALCGLGLALGICLRAHPWEQGQTQTQQAEEVALGEDSQAGSREGDGEMGVNPEGTPSNPNPVLSLKTGLLLLGL